MKKIISCIIAFVMILSVVGVSATSVETTVNAQYNAETKQIIINGTFPAGVGTITVLVSKYDKVNLNKYNDLNEANISTNVVHMAKWNGNGSLTLPFDKDPAPGFYVVFCGANGMSAVSSREFYITTVAEQNTAISAFKNATAETIAEAISLYSEEKPIINLATDDDVYKANAANVQKIFANCIADEAERLASLEESKELTLGDIANCFEKSLAVEKFNQASDKAVIITEVAGKLGISLTGDAATYKATAANLVTLQSEVTEGKISSATTFEKAFNKAVAISVINSNTRETAEANLKKYQNIIGIDADAGYLAAVKDSLDAEMAFGNFTTTELIAAAFNKAVTENPKPEGEQGGGSLGGNGGSGGLGGSGGGTTDQDVVEKPATSPESEQLPLVSAGIFTDVSSYEWANDAIKYLSTEGIIQGVGGGKFEPARNIKREEYTKIMVEAFKLSDKGEAKAFTDVAQDSWYYKYVNIACANGLITGIDNNNFGSGSFVTREQAAVIIYRYLRSTGYEFTTDGQDFDDFDNCSDYAKEAIRNLKNSGLINGSGNNCFAPKEALNRAQAAVMIYNIINAKEAK